VIGVGIVTCNRPEFLLKCYNSIPEYVELVVVNDGDPIPKSILKQLKNFTSNKLIENNKNLGVGKSKNILFRTLLNKGCDHIFIIEDDIIVKNSEVFNEYINARNKTGIQHFCFGYHGPANKNGISGGSPAPKFVVDYGDVKIAINMHSVGAFCYYTKQVLEAVGLIDESFTNAFEHVDHDYRIIKAGFSTPYWNFPDIANSIDYLDEIECSEKSSSIRPRKDWMENIQKGAVLFKQKHGYSPAWQNCVPETPIDRVKKIMKEIYKKYANKA
jgi:GT2 family glycosyltransferase